MSKIRQGISQINFKNFAFIGRVFTPTVTSGSAPTNIVTNPSFTTDIVGWDSVIGNNSRDTSKFHSAPASLNTYFDGEDNPYANYYQNNALTIGQRYSLSLWINNPVIAPTRPLTITFSAGSNTVTSSPTFTPSASWVYVKIENVLCTGSATLSINVTDISNYPAVEFNIDDVAVVLGPTAI